jgi:hypothetical protein
MAVPPKPYRFSTYLGNLCVTRGTDVLKLGAKLGMDPIELLRMINGKVVPTRAVISGLAKELHSNVFSSQSWPPILNRDTGQKH